MKYIPKNVEDFQQEAERIHSQIILKFKEQSIPYEDCIRYLARQLLDVYNGGFDAAILTIGDL